MDCANFRDGAIWSPLWSMSMTCVQVDIGKRDLRITAKARKKTIPQLFLYSGLEENVVGTVYNHYNSRSEIKTTLGEKGSWKLENRTFSGCDKETYSYTDKKTTLILPIG